MIDAAFRYRVLAIGVVVAPLLAQVPGKTDQRPVFAAASIKIHPANSGPPTIGPFGTGRFTAINVTPGLLIEIAFGVEPNQISGAPNWLYLDRYDFDGTAQNGVTLEREQVQPRLQRLLAGRFKLATHQETREFDGYRLVVAKGGPKLRTSAGVSAPGTVFPTGMKFQNISMAAFAPVLANPTGRPVIDKTGLKGNYDVVLNYGPGGAASSSLPSVFAALQDQLGLSLEPQKVPIQVLVIDHMDRVPSAN
jgi:uncharacterized protein (TIGR03435 family)